MEILILDKDETSAALAAVTAVLESGAPVIPAYINPLTTAKRKLEKNLEEYNNA